MLGCRNRTIERHRHYSLLFPSTCNAMTLDSPQTITFNPLPSRVMKQRWTKWLMSLLILGSLSGGGYLVYRQTIASTSQAASGKQITVPVSRETIPLTIAANGTVEAKQSTNVSPKSSGRLKSLIVQEGDFVTTGQPVAYMDASDLQGQLIQAQGSLAAAQANLQKLATGNRPEDIAQAESTLKSAQVTLSQAQADLDRYEQLYKAGAISAQSVSQYRTTRDTNQVAVDKAQQALKLLQVGNRQEDIAQARAQVTQAEGSLKTIQTQIEDAIIRAPFSGIVTAKYADPGDFVTPTTSGSDVSSATSSSILSLASTYQSPPTLPKRILAKSNWGKPSPSPPMPILIKRSRAKSLRWQRKQPSPPTSPALR